MRISFASQTIQFQVAAIAEAMRADIVVVPHELSVLSNLVVVGICKLRKIPLYLWGHARHSPDSNDLRIVRWVREKLIFAADYWLAYTRVSVDYLVEAGFPSLQIFCVNNSLPSICPANIVDQEISRRIARLATEPSAPMRAIFVGSLDAAKRIPALLSVASELYAALESRFSLHVIGDGQDAELVAEFCRKHSWCTWVGALWGTEKTKALLEADFALHPGMLGLNILDYFSAGLPIVSSLADYHSPEVAYVEDGRNAILVASFNAASIAERAARLRGDLSTLEQMSRRALATSAYYSVEGMVCAFVEGLKRCRFAHIRGNEPVSSPISTQVMEAATGNSEVVVFVIQRLLPYHVARMNALANALSKADKILVVLEVASGDASYAFLARTETGSQFCVATLFPQTNYNLLTAEAINYRVCSVLEVIGPTHVFCPATPFPEGMAAIQYRCNHGCAITMLDDAWEGTDKRGSLTRMVKSVIHGGVDSVFVAGQRHTRYFLGLGFDKSQIATRVDVVDNEYFGRGLPETNEKRLRRFLFVGRLLPRKGTRILIQAYERYLAQVSAESAWELHIVGAGDDERQIALSAHRNDHIVYHRAQQGDALVYLYQSSLALVVPSIDDPWGLVVNEGMAAGCIPLVSTKAGASEMIIDGENGWIFEPVEHELAALMVRVAQMPMSTLLEIGAAAHASVNAEWSCDRFAESAMACLSIKRREDISFVSRLAIHGWSGRVAVR